MIVDSPFEGFGHSHMSPDSSHKYDEAIELTAHSLQNFLDTTDQLTYLSLPDRTALVAEIARVVPAGNVPSLISAGLARLPGRVVSAGEHRRNLALLMQGMQTFMDRAVYQTFFAGPASVLAAYQMILRLTGKDLDQSFPEGTWQFYVEFGLREDSSRHTCETTGFQAALSTNGWSLDSANQLAAWLVAAAWLLRRYPDFLQAEWMERVRLQHMAGHIGDAQLVERWLRTRPYRAPADEDFLIYRQRMFEEYCTATLNLVQPSVRKQITSEWNQRGAQQKRAEAIAAYQRQMTIWAHLLPGEHSDSRVLLNAEQLRIGVIAGKRYYLVDLAAITSLDAAQMISQSILNHRPAVPPATLDKVLCRVHRRDQVGLRKMLPAETQTEIGLLHTAPILINWDIAEADTLGELRSGQRGLGDHAMTVFRAADSHVFDMSHIFFDGTWGMAVAEIMTGQATEYARLIAGTVVPPSPNEVTRVKRPEKRADAPQGTISLGLAAPASVINKAKKFMLTAEVSAESSSTLLQVLNDVRRNLRRRNDALRVTVNDLLMLYRAVFGPLYLPSTALTRALADLSASSDNAAKQAAKQALAALDGARQPNPVLLIPMDATMVSPRERIYPTTIRNPFNDVWEQHRRALDALMALDKGRGFGSMEHLRQEAQNARRDYLSMLHAFSEVLRRYKDVSLRGESVSTATIKMLAGLPPMVQRLLDSLPARIDVLNDVIKGQEVFSNVGQVAAGSSLRRFYTAKDDNEKKTLAWGFVTDAQGTLHISLRDFRPHIQSLAQIQRLDLAAAMTQDYLDAFARGLNKFAEELLFITKMRSQGD